MQIKKITFVQPGQAKFDVVESELTIARPTEVIIKNRYSLVSVGTELACLSGTEEWFPLPNTPGYAAVGKVVAHGSAVTKVNLGDLVLTHGPHAEYFKIDTTDRYTGTCMKLPTGLFVELAPFTRMATIAFASIRVANIELGDNVLVTGLGLVGNLAAQLAALQGARVIGVDLSDQRRTCAQACGLSHTVDGSRPDWKNAVRQIAGRRGVTTYIDATGLSSAITEASTLVAPHGETVLLGTPRAPHETNVTEIYRGIHLPGFITYKGALEWRYPTFTEEFVKHSVERNSEIIMELATAGKLRFAPLLTHRVAPASAPEIYSALLARKDESYLGVVFDWSD
jgi:2-desacetyl-2-hydroxyethyl bacteriochlorophyllide A dehydrogenase